MKIDDPINKRNLNVNVGVRPYVTVNIYLIQCMFMLKMCK